MSWLWWVPTLVAGGLSVHTVVNVVLFRKPPLSIEDCECSVAVLLPVRDEAERVTPCLEALLAQRGVADLTILVLDDGSTDGTADVIRAVAGDRVRLLRGEPPPAGWLGKPYACHQLAARTGAEVLVFVDADVVLAPDALAATVPAVRRFDLVTAYPRLIAETAGERLIQPLLPWSWLTFLPLRLMERSARPSLAAAGGQFLVVDAAAYRRAGGHAAGRDRVLEDVELARAVKRAGGKISLLNGYRLASCRMYGSWREVRDGYGKSLWASFGSPGGAAGVLALLAVAYLGPLAVAPWHPLAGLLGYLSGVAGRVLTGRATGARTWPDAFAQPVSIALFGYLVVRSFRLRRQGKLTWKGRHL